LLYIKNNIKNIKSIGGYMPINFEYDCLNILKLMEKNKYNVYLPIIKKNFQMDFYKFSFKDPLKVNRLGILEPCKLQNKVVPDLVFVPIVGFDKNFNRLGYGGGFYDRYFEKNSKFKKIKKIGLAFSFQKINKIPTNKYDVKLDKIITEKTI
jgi:5-formyltetrahydrofolate cyclo-ligase|tara:strand:+ start:863 stop:1318 length:456 start_codon:yes stop_codon:yes gene_type:complete